MDPRSQHGRHLIHSNQTRLHFQATSYDLTGDQANLPTIKACLNSSLLQLETSCGPCSASLASGSSRWHPDHPTFSEGEQQRSSVSSFYSVHMMSASKRADLTLSSLLVFGAEFLFTHVVNLLLSSPTFKSRLVTIKAFNPTQGDCCLP